MMLASFRPMQTLTTVPSEPVPATPPKDTGSVIEPNEKSTKGEEEPLDKYDLSYLACTD